MTGVLLVEVRFGSIIRVSYGVHRAAVGGGRVVLCVASVVAARCLAGKSPGVRQALRGHRWTSVGVGRRLRPLAAAVGQRGTPAPSLTNAPRLPPAGWSGSHATLPAGGGSCVTLTTPKVHLDQRGRSRRCRGRQGRVFLAPHQPHAPLPTLTQRPCPCQVRYSWSPPAGLPTWR